MGHYKGYTIGEYEELLQTLSSIKGKFILTNYDSDILQKYVQEQGRNVLKEEMAMTANHNLKKETRTELIVTNY